MNFKMIFNLNGSTGGSRGMFKGPRKSRGAGGTQGLAHWMSMMAEHMNHESGLHPAYMPWHNGIDQKMSLTEQQQLLQKGIVCHFNNQIHFGTKNILAVARIICAPKPQLQ